CISACSLTGRRARTACIDHARWVARSGKSTTWRSGHSS
ncbi:MAG: hypothetical protein AVDCRST_MAG53-1923, partial [uncultured Solirubrobacteraceae bacterium]